MMNIKFIRKLDRLGRIVIPKDVRATMGLRDGDVIVLTVENGALTVRKVEKK